MRRVASVSVLVLAALAPLPAAAQSYAVDRGSLQLGGSGRRLRLTGQGAASGLFPSGFPAGVRARRGRLSRSSEGCGRSILGSSGRGRRWSRAQKP